MFKTTKKMFKTIISAIAALFAITPKFGLETLSGGLLNYGDAVVNGVFQQKVEIMYDRDIYEDFEVYSKPLSVISKFGVNTATSNPVRGFDKTPPKTVFTLAGNSSGVADTANTEVTLTMTSGEPNNLVVRQKLLFNFTPSTSAWTNEAIITEKVNATTIKVKPANPTLKFGVSASGEIPSGTAFKSTATMFPDSSEAVKPVSFFETVIENFYTFIRNGYSYNELASKQNLYDKKSLRYRLDSDAKKVFLGMKEDEFLYGGKVYYKPVSATTDAPSTSISKMKGLFQAIKDSSSPAVVTYDGTTKTFMDAHEEWAWKLADPMIHENKRMVICDQAYQKFWTDLKTQRPGIELAPNTSYGIPGIMDVYTGIGNLVLELFVNDRVSQWQRLVTSNDYTKPFAAAIVPYKIKLYNTLPDTLYTELQNPSSTDHLAEYRCAFTWLGHNMDTANFGMISHSA